jgi:hypothetical protein
MRSGASKGNWIVESHQVFAMTVSEPLHNAIGLKNVYGSERWLPLIEGKIHNGEVHNEIGNTFSATDTNRNMECPEGVSGDDVFRGREWPLPSIWHISKVKQQIVSDSQIRY